MTGDGDFRGGADPAAPAQGGHGGEVPQHWQAAGGPALGGQGVNLVTAQCIPESPGRCEDGRPQYIDVFQSVLAWGEDGVRSLSVSSFQLWCLQVKSSSYPPVPTPAPAPDPDPSRLHPRGPNTPQQSSIPRTPQDPLRRLVRLPFHAPAGRPALPLIPQTLLALDEGLT